jgi:hypothetical protein
MHLPNDGSLIGGVQPQDAGVLQDIPGVPAAILFFVKGLAYATMEGYISRPNFVTLGLPYVKMAFTVILDDKVASEAQVLETDCLFTVLMPDGTKMKFDGSVQINIQKGWMIQVDGPDGKWIDTGVKIPPLQPNVPHLIEIRHFVDVVKKTHSVLSYSIDGTAYLIPVQFQNILAILTTWAGNCSLPQIQITTNGLGGGFDIVIDQMTISHSANL